MVKKLSLEDLLDLGLDAEQAKGVLDKQNEVKPRVLVWRFKATEADASKVAEAFPDLVITRPDWKK